LNLSIKMWAFQSVPTSAPKPEAAKAVEAADPRGKPIVDVRAMNWTYFGQEILFDINLKLYENEKILLIGPNGAGKSNLLRLLGGLHLNFDHDKIDVMGTDRPNDQSNGLTYMGNRWFKQVSFEGQLPYMCDIAARDMLKEWQDGNLERRDELVEILGIDLDWRLHQVSDGQRKKVQIMLACCKPFRLALIDEFINELDVVVRKRLYEYLDKEVKARNGCILYASHIFDNLEDHFTGVLYINNGRLENDGVPMPMSDFMTTYNANTLKANMRPSLFLAVFWKLRGEELAGNIEIEKTFEMDPLKNETFKGSGFGGGRSVFMRDALKQDADMKDATDKGTGM